jgi:MoaA/NifB/PqqE/SkfB family radical SAM enzyme
MLKEISIEIIRKCPNNCVHCSSSSDEHGLEMLTYNKFVSVVDDAVTLGAKIICLSGGEPFLHPDIIDMITYVYNKDVACYVYTSGIIFDTSMDLVSLSGDLLIPIVGKVSRLIFNVEAASSDTYDKVMGTTGCFEKMRQSVVTANSLSIITEAHFVPMKINVAEIEPTVILCKKLGISKISFLRLVAHGRAQINEDEIMLSDEEFLDLKSRLEYLQNHSDVAIRIGVPLSVNDGCHKCEAAKGKLNIKYDGRVFPCEVFKNDRAVFSLNGFQPESIYTISLREIYYRSLYLQYVRDFSQQFSCDKNCETCIGQYMINNNEKSV